MCKFNLRCACMVFGAIGIAVHLVALCARDNDFQTIVLLTLGLVTYLALFFGALFENEILVLVVLILKLLNLIYGAIVLLGIIFDFGGFRKDTKNATVPEQVVKSLFSNVVHLVFIYLIYAYYKKLHGSEDD